MLNLIPNVTRNTFILDGEHDDDNLSPIVIVTAIEKDGQVYCKEFSWRNGHNVYRNVNDFTDYILDNGGMVLAIVEGEEDISTGEASAHFSR